MDVTAVENRPESPAKRDSLAEDLQDAGAGGDAEVAAAAQRVLASVADHVPGGRRARTSVGIGVVVGRPSVV